MWDQQRGTSGNLGGAGHAAGNAMGSHARPAGASSPASNPATRGQGNDWHDARETGSTAERADALSVLDMRFPAAMSQFVPDTEGEIEGDESDGLDELDGFDSPDALPPGVDPGSAVWLRIRARKLIREFLRAVPRAEPEATIAIIRPDGVTRILTRAELSTAIDRLRPRQRQIIRLGVEERWARSKVCAYLHNISMKTFERDQVEALDILIQL
jgi:hypothetical protein